MEVKIKLLNEDARLPSRAHPTDAGMDIVATSKSSEVDYIEYGTGLSMAIPEGYMGLIFPRSSISKKNLSLCNSVGVIDSNYRGEIKIRFDRRDHDRFIMNQYDIGDKVAQLVIMPYPKIEFKEVSDLDETDRGLGGFGSSDVKQFDQGNITPITNYNLSEL